MKDQDTRTAILRLARENHGVRTIARAVGVGRNTVRRVLASESAAVPRLERTERTAPHEAIVRELHQRCEGNLVRVHEELSAQGISIAYTTLTGFCRRHGIGVVPKERAGRYPFEPGEEMQHDTSPHDVVVGGRRMRVQTASLVLCYSRRIFAEVYPQWTRFWAKVFLTDAIRTFEGACGRCMIDNSSVIVARGNGCDARQ